LEKFDLPNEWLLPTTTESPLLMKLRTTPRAILASPSKIITSNDDILGLHKLAFKWLKL